MVDLASFYERILIGNFAVPSALLGREEDQNRATLIGKIQFFLAGPVKATREWISNQISHQWYERNMRHMGMGDLLEIVRVKAEFEAVLEAIDTKSPYQQIGGKRPQRVNMKKSYLKDGIKMG